MAIVMYISQDEVLDALTAARKDGVDIKSSTCSVLYETKDDDIAIKKARTLLDANGKKLARADKYPFGVRKVQTMFGFLGADHDWTEKVRRAAEKAGADGSNFVAQHQNGKSWLPGFEKIVEETDKNGVRHFRIYPSPICKAKVRMQIGIAPGVYRDMTPEEVEEFKTEYGTIKKPYQKMLPSKDDPTKMVAVDVPAIVSLTIDKIRYIKFGGKEFVNIEF